MAAAVWRARRAGLVTMRVPGTTLRASSIASASTAVLPSAVSHGSVRPQ